MWQPLSIVKCQENKRIDNKIDFTLNKNPLLPITIKGQLVDIVSTYKYLGITIDDKLDWDAHASIVNSRMQRRLFFLRKLNSFNIDPTIMYLFYTSVIESVLLFCIQAWGGNAKLDIINWIKSTMKKCLNICNVEFYSPLFLLDKVTILKIDRILKDNSHPLYSKILFSKRRQGRLLSISTKTERHWKSFLPWAIRTKLSN